MSNDSFGLATGNISHPIAVALRDETGDIHIPIGFLHSDSSTLSTFKDREIQVGRHKENLQVNKVSLWSQTIQKNLKSNLSLQVVVSTLEVVSLNASIAISHVSFQECYLPPIQNCTDEKTQFQCDNGVREKALDLAVQILSRSK